MLKPPPAGLGSVDPRWENNPESSSRIPPHCIFSIGKRRDTVNRRARLFFCVISSQKKGGLWDILWPDKQKGADQHGGCQYQQGTIPADDSGRQTRPGGLLGPWCGYCRRIGPAYEKVAEEYGDRLEVVKINIDEEGQLAEDAQVEVIPTLILYRDGKALDSIVNPGSKAAIDQFIQAALSK